MIFIRHALLQHMKIEILEELNFSSIQGYTVIPFVIFPPKSGLFNIFSRGKHDNGQQFELLIFI